MPIGNTVSVKFNPCSKKFKFVVNKNNLNTIIFQDVYQIRKHEVCFRNKQEKEI